jgi:cytochrome c peroxidase
VIVVHRRFRLACRYAFATLGLAVAVAMVTVGSTEAQSGTSLASLKTVAVPVPAGLDTYVRDRGALVVLGKALFWDVQAGSDNRTACATCHFHAGADHRRQNQLASTPDVARPITFNRTLTPADFPFLQRQNQNNQSPIVRDTRLVAGSAGVAKRSFVDVDTTGSADRAIDPAGVAAPNVGGLKVRQATSRNSPSVINAVFNVRNFHDGRASRTFTGLTPFGDSDASLNTLRGLGESVVPHRVRLDNASLASQAVGPPINATEMAYEGRTWPKVAKKLVATEPLRYQQVAIDDSVLGSLAAVNGPGLAAGHTYASLVRAAFREDFWASTVVVDARGRVVATSGMPRHSDEYTQLEFNFPVFWGVALQAYQATLVSDDSRVDQFLEGRATLNAQELGGLNEFRGAGRCDQCHGGPELSAAGFTGVSASGFDPTRPEAFGFFRIAVSPIADDVAAGGRDAFGQLLFPSAPVTSRGTFKAPSLRNVELTGPYFHNGGASTLDQVISFYDRGGDFVGDGNVHAAFLAVDIRGNGNHVALLRALTDERVRFERAPFDHPALCVPIGHVEERAGALLPDPDLPGAPVARDVWALVPAVGRGGGGAPLQTFDELLSGVGVDGSRAHTMTQSCVPAPVDGRSSVRVPRAPRGAPAPPDPAP